MLIFTKLPWKVGPATPLALYVIPKGAVRMLELLFDFSLYFLFV
jgi:hypothetical protein